jgi:predicted dehydrogenase
VSDDVGRSGDDRPTGPVGVGVIGAGTISTQYLENLTRCPDVEVLFVADLDTGVAAVQAERFGVPSSGTADELLAHEGIEIVLNLTVPSAHVEVGHRILAAGKHVWSEKPLALDRDSGRALLDEAQRLGLRVATAPDTFLGAGLQTAQRVITDGRIGEPLNALVLFQSPGPESWHPSPEFYFVTGGGPLFDMGPYYLTALVQNLGPVARVRATSSMARRRRVVGSGPKAGTEFAVSVPTHYSALIEFEGGAAAQAIFSFESHLQRHGVIEIAGTGGTLALPYPNRFDGASRLWTGADEPDLVEAEGSTLSRGAGVVELARAIRGGRAERASASLAYHVLDVMASISEAAESDDTVDVVSTTAPPAPLPEAWDPAAPTLADVPVA